MRGAMLALAEAAKFAPLALFPLLAGYSTRRKTAIRYAAALAVVSALVMLPVLLGSGLSVFWDRTVGFQLGRDSPFSIWGQEEGLGFVQDIVKALAIALAIAVALVPRRKTTVQAAALGAAVMIALELALTHWFYLYIAWFFPLVLIALLSQVRLEEDGPESVGRSREHQELDRLSEPTLA
jgi:hypothetical protein